MTNVINDVITDLSGSWDSSVIERPVFLEGIEKYSKGLHNRMPRSGKNVVYVENPKFVPTFINPERTRKDVDYFVYLGIQSAVSGADRDKIFDEAYRIVEATGITGYENREIKDCNYKNEFGNFTAEINFKITKYGESCER